MYPYPEQTSIKHATPFVVSGENAFFVRSARAGRRKTGAKKIEQKNKEQ